MRNLTISGDEPKFSEDATPAIIPLEQWPEAVTRSEHRFEVNPLYFGQAVRTDRWSCLHEARPWHTLYLVLDGEIAARVGGEPLVLKSGTLFWLMPHEPHDMQWPAKLVFTEIWFRLQDSERDLRLHEPVMVRDGAWDVMPLMEGIEDEMRRRNAGYEAKIRHWLALVALEVMRAGQKGPDVRQLSSVQRARVTAFVRENLTARPSLEAMANAAGLSPDYFSRLFRNTYGLAPRDWMVRERIHTAARLLRETDMAIYQIGAQLGYANVSQFSRQFREVMGANACAYRQRSEN
jgi:AraC-like DNA-binding protein/mannose-6-phosphate isomerase-like protein (cupin superfamily)